MKIKSYHILFRFFSFLSDKTNGAPVFVKYKLILGTLIVGLAGTSASKAANIKIANDTVPVKSHPEIVTCYKPSVNSTTSDNVEVRGQVIDQQGEPIVYVTVVVKNTTRGVLTDEDGYFSLKAKKKDVLVFSYVGYESKEVKVSDIKNKPIVLEESAAILCYEVIVVDTPSSHKVIKNSKEISKTPKQKKDKKNKK